MVSRQNEGAKVVGTIDAQRPSFASHAMNWSHAAEFTSPSIMARSRDRRRIDRERQTWSGLGPP